MAQRAQNISTGEVKEFAALDQNLGNEGWVPVSASTPITPAKAAATAAAAVAPKPAVVPGQPGAQGNQNSQSMVADLLDPTLKLGQENNDVGRGNGRPDNTNFQDPSNPTVPALPTYDPLNPGNIWNQTADPSIAASREASRVAAESEKTRLAAVRDARLKSLEIDFTKNLAAVKQQNTDQTAAIKARLLKLGISPSDSSFDNTVQGQLTRNQRAEDALAAEYESNKAKVFADMEEKISQVAMTAIKNDMDSAIASADNILKKQGLAKDIMQIFSERDDNEKNREQSAYNALLDYQAKMASLDQDTQKTIAANFIDNAQKGFFNTSDKGTIELLQSLEKQSPYLKGLTQIASAGLADRLQAKASEQLNQEKTKWDIENIKSTIRERAKGSSAGSAAAKKAQLLTAAADQINELLHTTTDANGNKKSVGTPRSSLTIEEYNALRQRGATLGLDTKEFDDVFGNVVSGADKYAPAPSDAGSGSYIDKTTGKIVPIKATY